MRVPIPDLNEERRRELVKIAGKYAEQAKGLYTAIADLRRVIGIALTSNTMQPALIDMPIVLDQTIVVFASGQEALLGLLSSGIHGEWARRYASSLETRVRYTPSDVFETFPLPDDWASLSAWGLAMESARNAVMSGRGLGLTAAYNLVKDRQNDDPDVQALREAHVELDRAVLDAYGWSDLASEHGFFETEQGVRFTMNPSVTAEVLDRLLELNHARYADEVSLGQHGKQTASGQRAARKRAASDGDGEGDAVLFE